MRSGDSKFGDGRKVAVSAGSADDMSNGGSLELSSGSGGFSGGSVNMIGGTAMSSEGTGGAVINCQEQALSLNQDW